jgi:hypothetical protein
MLKKRNSEKRLNELHYTAALESLTNLFFDPTVSTSKCRENFERIKGEIDIFLQSLPE